MVLVMGGRRAHEMSMVRISDVYRYDLTVDGV